MTSLFVIRGNDQGSRYELSANVVGIGRDNSNVIQLHDTEVSRRHAEVRRQGLGLRIVDLGSSNGTFLNGTRVDEHELASGDQVQLGSTLMLFTASHVEPRTAERIDIIARQQPGDSSRIVRSIRQEEGSRLFDTQLPDSATPWLERAKSNLQVMYRTALAVSHTLDIDQLLDRIMQLIFEWVEADRGCVMLVDDESKKLEPKVRRDRQAGKSEERISISQTILDYVMAHNEGVLTSNARQDNRWNPAASILQLGVREAICVPMRGRYEVVGVIYIDTTTPPDEIVRQGPARVNRFNEEHLKLMIAIAHQAALAIEDTRHYSARVQAERLAAIGQTIAMLSHHIKNILQGIRGGSYLMELGLNDHDEPMIRKGWDIVEKNQKKISSLVLDMLTFSKEREPELEPAQLNEVAGDVVELMQARAAELGVTLEYHPAVDMPQLTFDPEGLHRAILNVVTNALDACIRDDDDGPPGEVHVSTRLDTAQNLAEVVVQDNGGGIAPEDRDKIFTLFVSRKGGRGTGLGLPVSNKILQEHGGRIVVESEPGKGSRFTLVLPAVPVEAAEAEEPPARPTAITEHHG